MRLSAVAVARGAKEPANRQRKRENEKTEPVAWALKNLAGRLIVGYELHAGGNWNNTTNCGSRCRNANNYRWNTNSNIGGRGCTRIQGGVELTPRLDLSALSGRWIKHRRAKHEKGAWAWLVANANAKPNIIMKRHGDLFRRITDVDTIETAYQRARKGKSTARNVIQFSTDVPGNLAKPRASIFSDIAIFRSISYLENGLQSG